MHKRETKKKKGRERRAPYEQKPFLARFFFNDPSPRSRNLFFLYFPFFLFVSFSMGLATKSTSPLGASARLVGRRSRFSIDVLCIDQIDCRIDKTRNEAAGKGIETLIGKTMHFFAGPACGKKQKKMRKKAFKIPSLSIQILTATLRAARDGTLSSVE